MVATHLFGQRQLAPQLSDLQSNFAFNAHSLFCFEFTHNCRVLVFPCQT